MNAALRRIGSATPLVAALALTAGSAAPATAAGTSRAAATTAITGGAINVAPGGAAYRTLRRAKVSVTPLGGAQRSGSRILVPVTGGKAGTVSELRAKTGDGFVLRRGKRKVRVNGLRVRLAVTGSRVTGRINGGKTQTLFTLGWRSLKINAATGTATGNKASWRLTAKTTRTLRTKLRVAKLKPGAFASSTAAVQLAGAPAPTPPPVAPTTPDATAAYALDWGLRESFRKYIVGGSIVASDGATVTGSGTYRFPLNAVTAYDASGALSASFKGTVYFEKHGKGEAAMLRLWVRNPRIEAPAGATKGSLYVDMTSKSLSEAKLVEYPNVRLAEVDLTAGSRGFANNTVTWSGVPTKLTPEGVDAFAGFYVAGDPLDPLNLSVLVP